MTPEPELTALPLAAARPSPRRLHRRTANVTVGLAALFLLAVLLGGFFAPLRYGPLFTDPDATLAPPSAAHWFGTDSLGRDVFARVVAGARIDLPLAILGTLLSLAVGVPIGLLMSGKGRLAARAMRVLDMVQAFPLLVVAIVIVALAGSKLYTVVIAIAFINVPRFVRLVRADALALRESRFVEAAIAMGAERKRVLFSHVLPNVSGTILAQASLTVAQSLVVIAALAFIGAGITPPTASWGAMIQDGRQSLTTGQWWTVVFPGLAIFLCIVCFNRIADACESYFRRAGNG